MKKIVVGYDGSLHAEKALEFAAEEAAIRDASLLVICAWQMPTTIDPMAITSTDWVAILREEAEGLVEAAVEKASALHPLRSREGRAVEGHPASVLLTEGADADMIVLGSHGRGGFVSLLLGSVTQQVIHHARCPVVVVRTESDS